jgi:hypothetical protein
VRLIAGNLPSFYTLSTCALVAVGKERAHSMLSSLDYGAYSSHDEGRLRCQNAEQKSSCWDEVVHFSYHSRSVQLVLNLYLKFDPVTDVASSNLALLLK